MDNRRNRDSKTIRAKFALPLLAAMAAVLAAALWLPTAAQAQEATADCGGTGNPLHGRTQKVVNQILADLVTSDCSAVTTTQLGTLTLLTINNVGLSSLTSDDFDGLSGLEDLDLRDNDLTALPGDVFDGLSSLTELDLSENNLAALPENVLGGLSKLDHLRLNDNSLTTLPEDVFDGLSALRALRLNDNDLAALPEDVFDGRSNLQLLRLNGNSLEGLPPDIFDGLSSLRNLYLNGNSSLACIHAGQFDGLSDLRDLHLSNTGLGNFRPSHASGWGLNDLQELNFGTRDITASATLSFDDYQAVFPALNLNRVHVTLSDELSDPICGSIEADADGSGFHTIVQVELEETRVRPNRSQASDAAMLGDGFCGSDATATRHQLWTWQLSDNGVAFTDMDDARQPKDYGDRAAGECSFTYTPQADDNEKYVRAFVPVDTAGEGENDYHSAVYGPLNIEQP